MRGAFLLALLVLVAVSLTGCRLGDNFPFYSLEECEDGSEIIYIGDIQYRRKVGNEDEQAYYYSGVRYAWAPAEGIGEQIGVCGDAATQYADLEIYEIAGDEKHIFLFTLPAHFYFGGTDARLWMQDSVTLGTPTAETVSSITIDYLKEGTASVQVDDPTMIAALLEAFNDDNIQAVDGGNWAYSGSLIMHHKEFPFLQYEVYLLYLPEQKIACCRKSMSGDWFLLSDDWYAVISEHDFPAQDE